jgi:hypothetical protein
VARQDNEVDRRNVEETRRDATRHTSGFWDAVGGSGRQNDTRRWWKRRDQQKQGEITEVLWLRILGITPPPVRGRG